MKSKAILAAQSPLCGIRDVSCMSGERMRLINEDKQEALPRCCPQIFSATLSRSKVLGRNSSFSALPSADIMFPVLSELGVNM